MKNDGHPIKLFYGKVVVLSEDGKTLILSAHFVNFEDHTPSDIVEPTDNADVGEMDPETLGAMHSNSKLTDEELSSIMSNFSLRDSEYGTDDVEVLDKHNQLDLDANHQLHADVPNNQLDLDVDDKLNAGVLEDQLDLDFDDNLTADDMVFKSDNTPDDEFAQQCQELNDALDAMIKVQDDYISSNLKFLLPIVYQHALRRYEVKRNHSITLLPLHMRQGKMLAFGYRSTAMLGKHKIPGKFIGKSSVSFPHFSPCLCF